MLHSIALLAYALLLGGMVFFAAVVAPLVFSKLPAEQSGPFIRAMFPVYYRYVIITSSVATLAFVNAYLTAAMCFVAASTVWLRQWLMPRINALSDQAKAGDARAKQRFAASHKLSVYVNVLQIALTVAVIVGYALNE